ncbi:hypothetical protein GCM10027448_37570 [Nocardioides dilutus]
MAVPIAPSITMIRSRRVAVSASVASGLNDSLTVTPLPLRPSSLGIIISGQSEERTGFPDGDTRPPLDLNPRRHLPSP